MRLKATITLKRVNYNPSDPAIKGNVFGFPYTCEESSLILIPVSHDVTVSYKEGTSKAPQLILDESAQLDLFLAGYEKPWEYKVAYDDEIINGANNLKNRPLAKNVINAIESGRTADRDHLNEVNAYLLQVNQMVYDRSKKWLEEGKQVGIVGGDHSSPYGLMKALSERNEFAILQIDAHMDLRYAYEGFDYSHASIMNNALKLDGVTELIQVGIRDYCEEEVGYIRKSNKKIITYFDEGIFHRLNHEETWYELVDEMIDLLPGHVYISFDLDGLDPSLCPNTGTPVPGGLNFNQIIVLFNKLAQSSKKIIGFDVCETGNGIWDANVASRVLYRLCVAACFTKKA